jgi:dTDP-4-amino-4,6-dideoxygalactose transaminase
MTAVPSSSVAPLAIDGGPRTLDAPLPGWPTFAQDEIDAAAGVLRSGKVNYWTGTEGREFEREFAQRFERRHSIALANGTLALELALLAYGIGKGDEVVVTPRSFMASASCVVTVGATPVFADVDRDSQNVTAESIERVLTSKTRAIIPVHLAGWPCDMDAIMRLARARNLVVIEDCAQSHGAAWQGRPSGAFGDAAAFSFCQDKIMTTAGEGGMLALDDEERWSWAWSYKDHGKSYAKMSQPAPSRGFRWVHDSFGTNWRLTEIQSAIGRLQLAKLDAWVATRCRNAAVLRERFAALQALRVPEPPAHASHACYKLYAFVRPDRLRAGWDRDRILAAIAAEGAPCFSGSCSEIYFEKAFQDAGWGSQPRLPVARELGETSLMWVVHPTLSVEHMHRIADATERVLHHAMR